MSRTLQQRERLLVLVVELLTLVGASYLAFGTITPPTDNRGFWFYTAMLGLVLGSRLDTPFFVKPADAILYAAPAATSLLLVNDWENWSSGEHVFFSFVLGFCVLICLVSSIAILNVQARKETLQRLSNSSRVLIERLGTPHLIYTGVVSFSLYAFHRESPRELGIIAATWALITFLSPIEGALLLTKRIRRIWASSALLRLDGEVVAFQTPGVLLVRKDPQSKLTLGDFVAVNDPLGSTTIGLALDHVGRDNGVLLRVMEVRDAHPNERATSCLPNTDTHAVIAIPLHDIVQTDSFLVARRDRLVGIVASDTSVERVFFELISNLDIEEGRLVEIQVGNATVAYQIVNGLTKEEVVHQKNTFGFARAQAQKIGRWDEKERRFRPAKWLPNPNEPVFRKNAEAFTADSECIGHFPGTDYGVKLGNVHDLVTHNTAILGILGVGKTMLATELVERMLVAGIKVICIDLTNQYADQLGPYFDASAAELAVQQLQSIGQRGRVKVHQNVEAGGSRQEFAEALLDDISSFVSPESEQRLRILNPAQFEVWRQNSRPFNNNASMASLSPAEITHIISEAALRAVSALGMADRARVCLVYEEAHSLVPEWNSAVAEGDRAASNGSARAILQGRKYGLGCLLITQRTANVSKTILNQCNTIFAMRTFDETGKEFLSNYLGTDYANSLSNLPERHAVLFGKGSSCENPVLIRLNEREDFTSAFRAKNPPPLPTSPPSKLEASKPKTEFPESTEGFDNDIPF